MNAKFLHFGDTCRVVQNSIVLPQVIHCKNKSITVFTGMYVTVLLKVISFLIYEKVNKIKAI